MLRPMLVLVPCLLATGLLTPGVLAQGLSGSRPNIVFVISDDHATHAISAYGSRINQTPNIDRLATTGALFRNNFCGNALRGAGRG